jgi:hypothetical protein
LAQSIGGRSAKSIFTAILQNHLDSGAKTFTALFHCVPLPVSTRNLGGPGDKPFAVALNYCCEFVPHVESIARRELAVAFALACLLEKGANDEKDYGSPQSLTFGDETIHSRKLMESSSPEQE